MDATRRGMLGHVGGEVGNQFEIYYNHYLQIVPVERVVKSFDQELQRIDRVNHVHEGSECSIGRIGASRKLNKKAIEFDGRGEVHFFTKYRFPQGIRSRVQEVRKNYRMYCLATLKRSFVPEATALLRASCSVILKAG